MYSGLFLVSVSAALLWLGTTPQKEDSKRESMSMKDAKAFPIFGSAVLLGLFLALKYLSKDIVNMLFRCLFSVVGIFSVYRMLVCVFSVFSLFFRKHFLGSRRKNMSSKNKQKDFSAVSSSKDSPKDMPSNKEPREPEGPEENASLPSIQPPSESTPGPANPTPACTPSSAGRLDVVKKELLEAKIGLIEGVREIMCFPNILLFSLSMAFNSLYMKSKSVFLANILACCFAVTGLQEIKPDSTKTVLLLLSLLFVYDIFWVFCTPVMISVAKNLDLPIKIVYTWGKGKASMIGLGDIVVPGLYLSVAREFSHKKKTPWVWRVGFLSYIISLVVTFLVVFFFKAGQPALLYICPMIVAGTMLGAAMYGRTKEFIEYQNE